MRLVFASLALICFSLSAFAKDTYIFENAFMRETPMKISAAYVTIKNPTAQDDILESASATWAGKVQLHDIKKDKDGVLQMTPMKDLPIPAGNTISLAPGGKHIMIYDIKEKVTAGQSKTFTLHFKNAGDVQVPFKVQPITYGGDKTKSKNADHHSHH